MLTVSKIPVPEPMAPRKSANIVNIPMHIPPNVAAVMTKNLIFCSVPVFVLPFMNIPCSLKFDAISLGPCPETSTQVLLNNAQPMIK